MRALILLLLVFLYGLMAFAQDSQEFIWRHTKTTLFNGKLYDTFENQHGDQAVKGRTKESQNPEEQPTAKNLPTRQAVFEYGMGIGYHRSSLRSLDLTKPDDPSDYPMYYDGSQIKKYPNSFAADITFAIHPPVKYLSRTTVGLIATIAGTSVPEDRSAENVWDYENDTFVAKGEHNARHYGGLNAYVTQDIWYIPAKESVAIFSAGVYYGYKANSYKAGVNEFYDKFQPDKGIIIKYKQVFGDSYTSFTNIYVQTLISKDRTVRLTAGWTINWGRPNGTPKIEVQK